jgi:hypothetical protein
LKHHILTPPNSAPFPPPVQAFEAELAATEDRLAKLRSGTDDTAGGEPGDDDTAGGPGRPWWRSLLRGAAVQLIGLLLALATTQLLLPAMQAAGRRAAQEPGEL